VASETPDESLAEIPLVFDTRIDVPAAAGTRVGEQASCPTLHDSAAAPYPYARLG
jgi:hypothetical protein